MVAVVAGILGFWSRREGSATSKASGQGTAAVAGSAFLATIEDKTPPPAPAPDGMVWIPGGEFSMGSEASSEAICGLPGVTKDALPVHRVRVDGF